MRNAYVVGAGVRLASWIDRCKVVRVELKTAMALGEMDWNEEVSAGGRSTCSSCLATYLSCYMRILIFPKTAA